MWLSRVDIEGLRAAPDAHIADVERTTHLPAPPRGRAIADAIGLLHSALAPDTATAALHAMGLTTDHTTLELAEGRLDEVSGLDPHAARRMVAPSATPRITIEVGLRPDPPMFRELKSQAARHPHVLQALSSGEGLFGATLAVKIGWLFNRAYTHASVGALALRIGEATFSTADADREAWLAPVLDAIGTRLHVAHPRDAQAWASRIRDDQLSPDPTRRQRVQRLIDALAQAPFHLPHVGVVQIAGQAPTLCAGEDLLPIRHWGPAAADGIALAYDVLVLQPDVYVAPAPRDDAWAAWVDAHIHGDDGTMEQVLWL